MNFEVRARLGGGAIWTGAQFKWKRNLTVTIAATATDPDGTVANVQFRDGTTLLGTDTTAPYFVCLEKRDDWNPHAHRPRNAQQRRCRDERARRHHRRILKGATAVDVSRPCATVGLVTVRHHAAPEMPPGESYARSDDARVKPP